MADTSTLLLTTEERDFLFTLLSDLHKADTKKKRTVSVSLMGSEIGMHILTILRKIVDNA